MTQKPGRFIVIEGLEGAGKTTAIDLIKQLLCDKNIALITTREPGGTYVGENVRRLLKEKDLDFPLDPLTELLLLYAVRVQLLQEVIGPALSSGIWVLADRFELSSYAYQGGGRKIDARVLDQLSSFCVKDTQPDWIIFL